MALGFFLHHPNNRNAIIHEVPVKKIVKFCKKSDFQYKIQKIAKENSKNCLKNENF